MAQFGRPDYTVFAGLWRDQGQSTVLWDDLDEVSPNDSDYAILIGRNLVSTFRVNLSDVDDPEVATGHVVRIRYRDTSILGEEGEVDEVELLQNGSTIIASFNPPSSFNSWNTYVFTLGAGQANSISDYTALSIRITGSTGDQDPSSCRVSWLEFEVPDAPTEKQKTYTFDTFLEGAITKIYKLDVEVIKNVFLRPDADITTDGWGTAPLWSKVDEEVPIDADSIGTSQLVDTGAEISLSPSGDPLGNTDHVLSVRAKHTLLGPGSANLLATLKEGSTTITTLSMTLSDSYITHIKELSISETNKINNYSNLSVSLLGNYSGAGDHNISVSWIEFRFPVGTFIDIYKLDIFLQKEKSTTYLLDVELGFGPPLIQPIVPESPPEMVSFQIYGVDEDGVETVEIFSAKDFENPRMGTSDTKLINYSMALEANRGRRLKAVIDDPNNALEEVTKGYLVDINLDNVDLGYRGFKFEYTDANGNFTDSGGSTDILNPSSGAIILDTPVEFGKWGKCVRLDGTGNARLIATGSNQAGHFFEMTNAILMAGWVRPKAPIVSTQRLVSKSLPTIDGYNLSLIPTNQVYFEVLNSGSVDSIATSTNTISTNAWNYIICYWTTSEMKLWIYNEALQLVEKKTGVSSIGSIGTGTDLTLELGNRGGLNNLNGDMDEWFFAPGGTNTLPSNIETIVEKKIAKANKCPVKYMQRGVILKTSKKNSQLTINADDLNIPTDYPLYDLMFEGQFSSADEVAFGHNRTLDISSVVSDTNVDILFQKQDGSDLASTDKVVTPIIFRIPKSRFIDVQSAGPQNTWDVSGSDFRRSYTEWSLETNERVELKNLRIGFCLNFNGVSGTYKISMAHFDETALTIPTRTTEIFTSDGSTGFKWVYHDMSNVVTGTKKEVSRLYILGIEPVRGAGWTSGTPLQVAILHATDDDDDMFGVTWTQTGVVQATPGGLGHYWWREDALSDTMDILSEGDGFDIIDENFIRIKNSDEFQVPDSFISTPIPSLILPTGSKGGFGRATYFYSTNSLFSSNYIERIFDKVDATLPNFDGRITSQLLAMYATKGGKALQHIDNIMRLSDSELTFAGGISSRIRDKVRSGYIKNPSFEKSGQASTDARHWKFRDFGIGAGASRITTESHSGDACIKLTHQNVITNFAEVYQDLSDVNAGQHFEVWAKVDPGDSDPDGLRALFYNYGSFENFVVTELHLQGLSNDWKKFTFTLSQANLTTLGEKNRVRVAIRSLGSLGSGTPITYIDDISPIVLYGFKDNNAPTIGNIPIQIEGPYIVPEPTYMDSIRGGLRTMSIIKAGQASSGFGAGRGKPSIAMAADKPSINFFGYKGDIRTSNQRGKIEDFYDEALSRLNLEKERQLTLRLAGQWAFLSGEKVAILYPDIGLDEYIPFPITSIDIGPEVTNLKSRIRISEIARPIKEAVSDEIAELEDVFEAPVDETMTQFIFGFVTNSASDYAKIELRESGVTTYREQTTDIKEMSDGSVFAIWKPERENLLTGSVDDLPYIKDIYLVSGADSTIESFVLNDGFSFRRLPNQWVILWLFLSDG